MGEGKSCLKVGPIVGCLVGLGRGRAEQVAHLSKWILYGGRLKEVVRKSVVWCGEYSINNSVREQVDDGHTTEWELTSFDLVFMSPKASDRFSTSSSVEEANGVRVSQRYK